MDNRQLNNSLERLTRWYEQLHKSMSEEERSLIQNRMLNETVNYLIHQREADMATRKELELKLARITEKYGPLPTDGLLSELLAAITETFDLKIETSPRLIHKGRHL